RCVYLTDYRDVEPVRAQVRGRAARADELEAEVGEIARDLDDVRLVGVVHADERGAPLRQELSGAHVRLGERGSEGLGAPHDLAGRLHFGTEQRVDAREADE